MVEPTIGNAPSAEASPQGRRVLVAVVTGELGDRIQSWRQRHDPQQAMRLPPHTTLCYWVPDLPLTSLEAQVRHAFEQPVSVTLGDVAEFENDQHTFYIRVCESSQLDEARTRLYDGLHAALPPFRPWTWHVTCVRDSTGCDLEAIREAAAKLDAQGTWHVETVACLELRGERYEPVAKWCVA